jgi:hypothetical protein
MVYRRRSGSDLVHLHNSPLLQEADLEILAAIDAAEVRRTIERIRRAQRLEHGYERRLRRDIELRQGEVYVLG